MTENKTLAELLKWINSKQEIEMFLLNKSPTTKPVRLGRCQALYETSEHIKKIMADNQQKQPK